MINAQPGALVHFGQDAINRFLACMNSFLLDDATGKSYVIYRDNESYLQMCGLTMCRAEAVADALFNTEHIIELDMYEMIVIDSGNSHGDSWIATFYPKLCVMTFVDQLTSYKKQRQNMSFTGANEPKINYCVLHKFADDNKISYNELCAAVQECLILDDCKPK